MIIKHHLGFMSHGPDGASASLSAVFDSPEEAQAFNDDLVELFIKHVGLAKIRKALGKTKRTVNPTVKE